jgi:hypothetical protein
MDATAQQVLLNGSEEYSRGRSGCGSRCNSGTGVFEKTPLFFFDFGHLKVDATVQQAFSKDLKNIQGVGLDVEADAIAEKVFLKRPLHFYFFLITLKWMQLRNRHFPKDTLNI